MFIELVEVLRCIHQHDESWLVASIDEMRGRSIRKGTLGCPVCGAQYPVDGGVASFCGAEPINDKVTSLAGDESPAEIAVSAGGLLGLEDASGVVILAGRWALGAAALSEMAEVRIVAINAPDGVEESPSIARVNVAGALPVGPGSCAGVALDDFCAAREASAALRAVRPGGRVIGPKGVRPPSGLIVLVQDERWWVAERPPEVTSLRRGNR